jgi:cell division protein FtsX
MRNSGLTPLGAACFVALMIVMSPVVTLACWATPQEKGFGKFRARERIFDLEDLEESTHTLDPTDRRFFIQPDDTPSDAWWHEEIRILRMLESQTMHEEAVTRLRRDSDERNMTRLIVIFVAGMLAVFAVALYAMRYLK